MGVRGRGRWCGVWWGWGCVGVGRRLLHGWGVELRLAGVVAEVVAVLTVVVLAVVAQDFVLGYAVGLLPQS